MNCQGYYEAEVIDNATGETVQYWKSKNTVNYGFIGGLFKHLFGVGSTAGSGVLATDPSKYADYERAFFGRLYLFKDSTTVYSTDNPDISNYTTDTTSEGKGYRTLESNGNITQYSVAMETSPTAKVTLTFQVTFSTSEGLYQAETTTTWNSIGVGSINVARLATPAPLLLTRVKMANGIQKSNTQTLRVRYNFSIVVA